VVELVDSIQWQRSSDERALAALGRGAGRNAGAAPPACARASGQVLGTLFTPWRPPPAARRVVFESIKKAIKKGKAAHVRELVDGCDEPSYLFIAVENEQRHVEVVRALLEVGGRELAMICIFFPR